MVILQLFPEMSNVQLQSMESQFKYESQEHHFLLGEKQSMSLLVAWGGGHCYFGMFVSSSAIGISHCLPPTVLDSSISLVLQAHGFIVHSGNQILLGFLPLLKSLVSSIFPITITLSSICQCLEFPFQNLFKSSVFLMYFGGIVKSLTPGFRN